MAYINCLNCNKRIKKRRTGTTRITKQPIYRKFCDSSCAASYNNKLYPKRALLGRCANCSTLVSSSRKFCDKCWVAHPKSGGAIKSKEKWANITKQELFTEGNANCGKWPYVRGLARKWYMESDKPKRCAECGYDKHFEVAHIRSSASFSMDATIAEINALDNLIALCRNCHWEFDNGYLTISYGSADYWRTAKQNLNTQVNVKI